MRITDIPIAILRFQYGLARFPLQIVEDQVLGRLDEEAPARLFYERSMGMLDETVGSALGDADLARRGAEMIERSEALRNAADLDAMATETVRQAGSEVRATRERAAREQQDARAAREREVQEVRGKTQQRKRAAVDRASERVDAEKKHADEVAAARLKDAETVHRGQRAGITAVEQSAAAAAAEKAGDAAQKHSVADIKREKADRIEDLAEAEKEHRARSDG